LVLNTGPNDTAASAGKAQEDAMEETVKKCKSIFKHF